MIVPGLIGLLLFEAVCVCAVLIWLRHIENKYLEACRRDAEILRVEIMKREKAHQPVLALRKKLIESVARELASS
jgi:hypothetical protein